MPPKLKPVAPTGQITDRASGEVTTAPAGIAALVDAAWQQQTAIDAASATLDGIKAKLLEAIDADATITLPGLASAIVATRESVGIVDADKLRAVLGPRFDDLVATKPPAYAPQPRLIEMAASADEPLAPALAALLNIKRSRSISLRAAKP